MTRERIPRGFIAFLFAAIATMKEKRWPSLFIAADPFSTLYSFKRNDRVTLLLAAIQPENIGLAAALLSVLSLDLTQKQAPCRARFTPESATDPL